MAINVNPALANIAKLAPSAVNIPAPDKAVHDLQIDAGFRALIPELTADELTALTESIKTDGCRDAVVVWRQDGAEGDIVIDGHHRYDICHRHNIPFSVIRLDFASREDVIVWMINNQFARRNLTPYQRAELALRVEPILAASAKERQLSAISPKKGKSEAEIPVVPNLAQREKEERSEEKKAATTTKKRTRDALADIAGVSHGTIDKAKKIREKGSPELIAAARNGEISVDAAYRQLTDAEKSAKDAPASAGSDTAQNTAAKAEATKVLKLPADLYDRLFRLATRNGISMSDYISDLLDIAEFSEI